MVGSRNEELQKKLQLLRERKELLAIEEGLAPVSTGNFLTWEETPNGVWEARQRLWDADSEPADLIPDDTEAPELALWMEDQLARRGIGGNCYVATQLSIKPWIECIQAPDWTRTVRTVLPDPIILAGDYRAVIGFLELEHYFAVYAVQVTLKRTH